MNKLLTLDQVAASIPDGATVAIGGSALSRKPMAMVRALVRAGVTNLRIVVDIGGPDVDLLIGAGAVREVLYAFVGFEVLGLAPHFRRARQTGTVNFQEWTEYTVMAGLDAAIKRVPFLPTRSGLASSILDVNPAFRRIHDPFGGEDVVAVPRLEPDFALIHVNFADIAGNGVILGDSHVDALCAKAAHTTFMSCDALVDSETLHGYGRNVQILRVYTDGVVEVPWGAHPTSLAPAYRADVPALLEYLQASGNLEHWRAYQTRWVAVDHIGYLNLHGGQQMLQQRLAVLKP